MLRTVLGLSILGAVLIAAAPAAAATLTRGPYLQLLSTHSVTIVWNTDVPAACSLAIHPLDGAATAVSGETGTVCAIAVDGLSPGTQYGYTPNADGMALRSESVFQTDDPSRPFTFVVLGDSGSADAAQFKVRDLMLSMPADFIVHTGDMVYEAGTALDFNPRFFVPYQDLLRTRMFWPCVGNHDYETANAQPWRDAFYTPANNPAGSENYYSFDYGNAHFAMIDSNETTQPGSPQYEFLDQDLDASDAFWKLVVFHHTIYSNSLHGSNEEVQANLVPLFDRYSVDLVLMGHDHDYERTFPLRANQIVAPGAGTVYITTGGGGQKLYGAGASEFTAYSESAHHITRVTVNGKTLEADMVRDDGQVPDSVMLTKDAPSPKCRSDADCDDSVPCTVDTCQPEGCHHEVVSLKAVQVAIDATTTVDACAGQSLPPFVAGLSARAARTVDRAASAANPRRADQLMTVAVQQLVALERRVDHVAKHGGLAAACAAQLRAALDGARNDGECLASRRNPVADTYISAGNEGRRNHGGATYIRVDASPVRIAYLKFDLSAVQGPVRRAVLDLHPVTSRHIGKKKQITLSTNGGRVYHIPDSTWREGVGDGVNRTISHGAGLTFDEVDGVDGDKILEPEDSLLVPVPSEAVAGVGVVTLGQVLHLNVTRAFQRGPGLYTLAIMSDGAHSWRFASRENPHVQWRPVLHILQ